MRSLWFGAWYDNTNLAEPPSAKVNKHVLIIKKCSSGSWFI